MQPEELLLQHWHVDAIILDALIGRIIDVRLDAADTDAPDAF